MWMNFFGAQGRTSNHWKNSNNSHEMDFKEMNANKCVVNMQGYSLLMIKVVFLDVLIVVAIPC